MMEYGELKDESVGREKAKRMCELQDESEGCNATYHDVIVNDAFCCFCVGVKRYLRGSYSF